MANESAITGPAAPTPATLPAAGVAPLDLASPEIASPKLDVARLVEEHQTAVWRYLRVLGCPAADAEDLTQETFLAVLTKPFRDYNRQATAAYLRQVARNLFISSRRRAVPAAELDEAEAAWLRWTEVRGAGSRETAHDDGAERVAALQKCLQTLTERARLALHLRFGRQATRSEIAAALSLSEDGAKNVLQRAKQHLRACIEKAQASDDAQASDGGAA